jgi:hypothetical protein
MTVSRVGDSRRASYKRISVMGLMFWMYFPQMLNKRCCCKFGSGNGFVLFDPIKIALLMGFRLRIAEDRATKVSPLRGFCLICDGDIFYLFNSLSFKIPLVSTIAGNASQT